MKAAKQVSVRKEQGMPYLLKGCARCGGDLCESWDFFDGFYRSCLQCGRRATARPRFAVLLDSIRLPPVDAREP
jgi:hypothetical protein